MFSKHHAVAARFWCKKNKNYQCRSRVEKQGGLHVVIGAACAKLLVIEALSSVLNIQHQVVAQYTAPEQVDKKPAEVDQHAGGVAGVASGEEGAARTSSLLKSKPSKNPHKGDVSTNKGREDERRRASSVVEDDEAAEFARNNQIDHRKSETHGGSTSSTSRQQLVNSR